MSAPAPLTTERPLVFHPKAVHARITSACDLDCKMCERQLLPPTLKGRKLAVISYGDGRNNLDLSRHMSEETWDLVKEKLMPHTGRMELGGLGEPTIAPVFVRAARDVVAAGKELFFFTNGRHLAEHRVYHSVGDAPQISVSIDAGTPEGYLRIRGADLQTVIDNVTAFKDEVPGAKICSQFTGMRSNIDELPAWVELCAQLGIGRTDRGEELRLAPADHHVTSRIDESLRFFRDRTLRAIDAARVIAEREGLWFMATPPVFSALNANAGEDDTGSSRWRRYTDFSGMTDGPNEEEGYGSGTTCSEGSGSGGIIEGDFFASVPWFQPDAPTTDSGSPVALAPREMYVDHPGTVWSCLARHEVGHVKTGTWHSIVEHNLEYQSFLRNWTLQSEIKNQCCAACPNKK